MSGFIEYLEARAAEDTRVRATLRRSLSFAPGAFVPAFPYVEPFLAAESGAWPRVAHYLVAGLWAAHWREGPRAPVSSIGKACAAHRNAKNSASTEGRFIAVLDADTDQLPHRLRQLIALLAEQSIDFRGLLAGLLRWNDTEKRTQIAWARDFYRNLTTERQDQPASEEEAVS